MFSKWTSPTPTPTKAIPETTPELDEPSDDGETPPVETGPPQGAAPGDVQVPLSGSWVVVEETSPANAGQAALVKSGDTPSPSKGKTPQRDGQAMPPVTKRKLPPDPSPARQQAWGEGEGEKGHSPSKGEGVVSEGMTVEDIEEHVSKELSPSKCASSSDKIELLSEDIFSTPAAPDKVSTEGGIYNYASHSSDLQYFSYIDIQWQRSC